MKKFLGTFKKHILAIVIGTVLIALMLSSIKFPEYSSQVNLLALILTLAVLLRYAYDT